MRPEHMAALTCRSTFFEQVEKLKQQVPATGKRGPRQSRPVKHFEPAPWDEVAGALGFQRDTAMSKYVRAKYAGSEENLYFVYQAVLAHCRRKHPDWLQQARTRTKIKRLILLVGFQNIMPNVCLTCRGVRWRKIDTKLHVCHDCGGSGVRVWRHKEIADAVGVKVKTYRNSYTEKHRIINAYYAHFEHKLLRARL